MSSPKCTHDVPVTRIFVVLYSIRNEFFLFEEEHYNILQLSFFRCESPGETEELNKLSFINMSKIKNSKILLE